jgi:hypothetical protein
VRTRARNSVGPAIALVLSACGAPKPPAPSVPAAPPADGEVRCTADPSAPASVEVPEASAAVVVPGASGGSELVVLADSDRKGAALVVPIDPAGPARPIRLPLDAAASDDIEGGAWLGGVLYTLTSSGWVRAYRRTHEDAFELVGPSSPIAEPPITCTDPRKANCASNFEGLCLREGLPPPVVGFAASKQTSTLHPLERDADGRLRIAASVKPVALPLAHRTVSDCTFGPDGRLLVATNLLGLDRVYEVDATSGEVTPIEVAGLLNDEAIAVDPRGRLWLFEDDGKSPSAMRRFECSWPARR